MRVPPARTAAMRVAIGALACSVIGGAAIGGQEKPAAGGRQTVPETVPSPPTVDHEEQMKQLVVMIRGELAESETIGAGIIAGLSRNRVYIATANHVVRQGPQEARNLRVEFRWLPGEPVDAVLLSHADAGLDLAVLSVVITGDLGMPRLPLDRLGAPSELKRRDLVYFIGFPNGRPWHSRVTPDPISQTSLDTLRFESTLLAQGHSGGALVDRKWRLVGMIRSDQPPEGEAVSIDRVLEKLREWNYPVRLTTPLTTASSPSSSTGAEIKSFSVSGPQGELQLCYAIENAVSARITPAIGELDPGTLERGCVKLPTQTPTLYTLSAVGGDGQESVRKLERWPAAKKVLAARSSPADAFRVTGVWADVRIPSATGTEVAASYSGPCPREFLFIGTVTTNGPGWVLYRWERSDGMTGPTEKLESRTAGTSKVKYYSWSLGRSDPDYSRTFRASVTLVVLQPNQVSSKPAMFLLECRNRD